MKNTTKIKNKIIYCVIFIVLLTTITGLIIAHNGLFLIKNNSSSIDTSTTITLSLNSLPKGVPIQLKSTDNRRYSVLNQITSPIEQGTYQALWFGDGIGGIDETITITNGTHNTFDLTIDSTLSPSNPTSSSAQPLPTPITTTVLTGYKVDTSTTSSAFALSSQGLDSKNQEYGRILVSTSTEKDTATLSSTNDTQQTIIISEGCSIHQTNFDSTGTKVRYFQICDQSTENGFYEFNLTTEQKTLLLPTSDSSNSIKVAIDPHSQRIVYTNKQGDLGIVENGKGEVILRGMGLSAPVFSPDGSHLLVVKGIPTSPTDTSSPYSLFGIKVLTTPFEALLTQKNSTVLRELGTSYYVPQPDDESYRFWDFRDSDVFRVGHSPLLFSITNGLIAPENTPTTVLGRSYKGKDGVLYYVYGDNLFDSEGVMISEGVSQVIEKGDEVFFVINNYLFRISSSQLVQAHPYPILEVLNLNNTLTLLDYEGNLYVY